MVAGHKRVRIIKIFIMRKFKMKKIKDMLALLLNGPYDTSTEEGRSKERTRSIALTAISALLTKIVAMATPLITVRITLSYMGEELYGLWTTVVSFFAMFTFADLGLGSGLQTELSRTTALADEVECKKLVSSCYTVLIGLSTSLILLFAAVYHFIDWGALMNASSPEAKQMAGGVVAAIVVSRILNVPMAIIQRTQLAMQEGYRANIWQCFGNLLSLILVVIISELDLGVLTMVWAYAMITVIVSAVNMSVYFGRQRLEIRPSIHYFDKAICFRLLRTGVAFFVLSTLTSISLSIDNVIVAHTTSLSDVTSYSILHKIVAMIGLISSMLSSPMWSANGEALQRGEFEWVRTATHKMLRVSLAFSALASISVLVLINPVLKILTDSVIQADYTLLLGMCLYQILVSITSPFFMVLNAGGIVRFQIINYAVYALVSLPLKYVLGLKWGSHAITWVGTVTYALLLTIPTIYRSQKHLNTKK